MKALKKVLLGVLSLACVATASVGLVGCGAGKDGKDGKDGKSAYEIWLANGYSGTEADFLDWLKADVDMQEQEGTDGLAYYPLPDGTYAVAQGNTIYLEEIVIPSTYKGKAVTVVEYRAFAGSNLKSITIPDSVTSIGEGAFYYCNSLTSVVIPDSVISIGEYAFYNCRSLTSVVIPDGVSEIGDEAFSYCNGLTSVVIPDSVTSIGTGAFAGCDNLQYTEKDGLKYLGNSNNPCVYLLGCQNKSISSAIIDSACRVIGSYVFENCKGLTSVVIPDGVTSIGCCAFSGCSSLTSVVIPDGLTSIGEYAFVNCSSLTSVYYKGGVDDWNNIYISWENESLTDATLYYYSESQPTERGNYWHYDENGEVIVW